MGYFSAFLKSIFNKQPAPAEGVSPLRITVIIPTLNPGAKLLASLNSVTAQKEVSVEVLVVDGMSKDGTVEKVADFGDPVRLITEPRKGIYAAMNRGLAEARGDILYFLGAGDRLRPGILRKVVSKWPKDKCVMFYGNVWMEDLACVYDGEFTTEKLARKNICHQGIFYSREVFAKHGNYEECYPILADYAFNLRVYGDPTVKKVHVPWLISDYEGNGFSANNADVAFESAKPALCLQYLGVALKSKKEM